MSVITSKPSWIQSKIFLLAYVSNFAFQINDGSEISHGNTLCNFDLHHEKSLWYFATQIVQTFRVSAILLKNSEKCFQASLARSRGHPNQNSSVLFFRLNFGKFCLFSICVNFHGMEESDSLNLPLEESIISKCPDSKLWQRRSTNGCPQWSPTSLQSYIFN